jgi:NTE family protein
MLRRTFALALQGGGSHGAYTWGVLDRLLEDDGLDIEGLSGASAGAVNAVLTWPSSIPRADSTPIRRSLRRCATKDVLVRTRGSGRTQ